MIIDSKMQKALGGQVNAELYAAYLYLGMAAYFEEENLSGFATWMRKQAKEEVEHAMRIYDYVHERGGKVELEAIKKPEQSWKSPLAAFQGAYEHEKKVTKMIDDLVDMANKLKDKATVVMLNWFVEEQVEEEDQTLAIVERLKMVKDSKQGLLMMDAKLGERK